MRRQFTTMPATRFRFLIIAMVFTVNVASVFAADDIFFNQGMQAFKSKNYPQAIRYFNQAKAGGYNRFVIEYNLGVSHYKLGQYLQAEKSFQAALTSEKLKPIVQYNLGLVKLKQKQKREAIEWFKKAARSKDNPKISTLANRMIKKYSIARKQNKQKNFLDGGVNLAYGHDSNVTQAATGSPSEQHDDILETYAYLNILFKHVDVKFSYFHQDFATIDSNDFTQLGTALAFPVKTGKWKITPSLHYASSQLDNMDYQSTSGLRLDLKRYTSKGNYLRFRYQFDDVESDNPLYDYLDGTRQRFRGEYLSATAIGRLRLRYEYETNDRQETSTRNYSPTRHSLRLRLKNSLTATFRIKNEIVFRNSVYEAAGTDDFTREDNRFQYKLNLYATPISGLELGVRYTYTDNDSNMTTEIFTRNVTQGYLNWYF